MTYLPSKFALYASLLTIVTFANANIYNVKDFGAANDSSALATSAVQAAVDSAFENGGGIVYFPPGNYLSGTIILKDNITLHLPGGATIFASRDTAAYIKPLPHTQKSALFYANGAKNITIYGDGTIHGQAKREYRDLEKTDRFIAGITENAREAGVEMKMYYITPPNNFIILFADCKNVRIENISMLESSFWTCHLLRCEQVMVRGVYIYSDLESGVNADGLDISSCKDVTISDCIIITGDDAIVLKTRTKEKKPCENVTVSNCVLSSSSTALKLGTESKGHFRHILFNNCVIRDSNRGLSIVIRDGATASDVVFSNITIDTRRRHFNWWGNGDPIWLVVKKRRESSPIGRIKNIVFENIIAYGKGTSKIESDWEGRIENIRLKNVQLFMQAEDYADKRADHAFFAKNVQGLEITDMAVAWDTLQTEKKWASALEMENVRDLRIRNFRGRQGLIGSKSAAISLKNVNNAWVNRAEAEKNTGNFIHISGENTRQILLEQIDVWEQAKQRLIIEKDVPRKAVKMKKN